MCLRTKTSRKTRNVYADLLGRWFSLILGNLIQYDLPIILSKIGLKNHQLLIASDFYIPGAILRGNCDEIVAAIKLYVRKVLTVTINSCSPSYDYFFFGFLCDRRNLMLGKSWFFCPVYPNSPFKFGWVLRCNSLKCSTFFSTGSTGQVLPIGFVNQMPWLDL